MMEEKKSFVLVTGASSGVGKCLAINLSQDYNVILHGRNVDRLNETKLQCSKDTLQLILSFDLERVNETEKVFSDFITQNNIEVNHFVHCAGFMQMVPLKMVSLDLINKTLGINFISPMLLSKVLTKKQINPSLKSIVFISSNISNFGAKAFSTYASSKGALDSLMRCLAVELSPKVRINSVLPGAIHTSMTENIFENPESIEKMKLMYPLGLGKPEDIYEIVSFLLSDKSRWITGQQITVDGGRTINISG